MNILVISHEFPPIGGGGANACLFLTKGYAEAGHKVTLVTVWYEGLQEHEIMNGVEIFRVKSKRAYKEHCSFKEMLSYILKALPVASKLAKKGQYDICQVFFGIPSGPIGYWLKKRYEIPYIIRFGGGDIPGFQDRFKMVYKLISPFVKVIWKNAAALVANSEGLQEFAYKFYDKKPVDVIYNGVDTDKFYPDYSKRNSEQINLLFISRLIERKGLQYIIPELKEIQSASDKPIHFTIVGDGPYREHLEELAEQHGVKNMITFAGQKDKEELLSYYQAGDIFVFPSKREGMPNAVLEAMACGLPIVMTPCEGSKELIRGNGYIADVEKFKEYIQKCMTDNINNKMSKESCSVARTVFSWDCIVEKYMQLMKKILNAEK